MIKSWQLHGRIAVSLAGPYCWQLLPVQLASYFMLAIAVMTVPQLSAADGNSSAVSLVAAGLLAISWVLLLQRPKLYTRRRLQILTVLRLLMAWAGSRASNVCLQANLHSPNGQDASHAFSMLIQLLLATNAVHIPMLALRLPMPMLQQLLLTAAQPVLLLLGGVTQDLAGCTNSTESQSTLQRLIASWGALVESGTFVPVTNSQLLQCRSSAMLVALCTVYVTTVGVTLYVCYMSLWADMICWLRQKARTAGDGPGEDAGSDFVTISGCRFQRQQVRSVRNTPASVLLLNQTGIEGYLSRILLHLSVVNMLCLACLMLSQLLAQKLLPSLLPQQALDCCYPQVPAL